MNKFLSFFLLLFFNAQVFGQNDAKLSIFNLNQMNFNPAYAGASDGLNVIGIYSNQWLGFEGAPKTQYLAIDSNLENRKIGIGFNLNSDQSGASLATNLESNFSYTVTINSKIKTTFGAKIGYSLNKIDLNLLNRLQPEEAVFGYDKLYSNTLILGAGLNIFTDNFFIGFSSPNFLTKKYYDPSFRNIIASNRNLFYTTIGYKFVLNREYSLTPTLLTRAAAGSRISTIASLNLNWQEKLLTGINLDYDASIGAYFAINAFKGIKVGYGYDRSLRKFNQYNNGSHTFFVNYYLENNNSKKCSCKL
jgi:type IX secretion system PorP/SprF family membrane protein